MGGTGVDEDRVAGTCVELPAVVCDDLHLRPGCEVDTRSLGEIGIDVDGGDVPPRADHLGEDRCVVADAAADVQDAVTEAEVQRIAPAGERTRLAVVQASCRVDRHQHVGVQVSRVGVGGEVIDAVVVRGDGAHHVPTAPGRGTALARRTRRRPGGPASGRSLSHTQSRRMHV